MSSSTINVIENLVADQLYRKENTNPAIRTQGPYVFAVKLSHSTEDGKDRATRTIGVRSTSAEGAKSLAMMVASHEGLKNVQVMGVEANPTPERKVPTTHSMHTQPRNDRDGMVPHSKVSKGLESQGEPGEQGTGANPGLVGTTGAQGVEGTNTQPVIESLLDADVTALIEEVIPPVVEEGKK